MSLASFNFYSRQTERTLLSWKRNGEYPTTSPSTFSISGTPNISAPAKKAFRSPYRRQGLPRPHADSVRRSNSDWFSTSRHITQGWLDLLETSANDSGTEQKGTSRVVANDPYENPLRLPSRHKLRRQDRHAHGAPGDLPVRISNHQQWPRLLLLLRSPRTFNGKSISNRAPEYHFPPSPPDGVRAMRVGSDGVNLHWREQYYLNNGVRCLLERAVAGWHALEGQCPTAAALNPTNNLRRARHHDLGGWQISPARAETHVHDLNPCNV